MLPDSGAFDGWNYAGDLTADFPDEGSGDHAEPGGDSRGFPEQLPDAGAVPEGIVADGSGALPDCVCGAGAAFDGILSGGGGADFHFHGQRGRGPLYQPVGAGFPAQLPENFGIYRPAACPPGGQRFYRHGHPGGEGGYSGASGAAGSGTGDHRF